MATQDNKSAGKVLKVLDVLLRNFAHGFSNSELVKETGYSASDITRYVSTLESSGFAERIPETGRIRPSHRLARQAVQILQSLEAAQNRLIEARNRLYGGPETQIDNAIERIRSITNG
ncbi:helix-turn-helix domain-containing protein [Methylobacter sp.]|uniref:helix-turn-helix domain-containing protein n=1 Tax=Methylobacter sp. TaxID=2051955 RepID=UPI0024885A31|nr:helix-turn-helix domain-containing protein [Methylobacter sp.]MDI1278050.1 helix-turn-helix domain-containing protein [Methylobacter sp.]